ncbi:hypothetical protein LTR10_011748 [Elasticomyces elasticus]|uniref:aldehyde dehydrogenase (NAD(+)) n=1 Tax=Exophiala sideris TaxID=1016849 RepID=A0ABR0JDL3_9EURO|nr:hypothetical protein LTR10_011748 [Elasticomyces elasticus]KAK5031794.1 hypothetical protein LTS07_004414 [Exophiala sideris]KAK5040723.1 hypothetical protein LTR13_003023 [Exophiala sideris]KAK5061943.1 hypothetical protein LTR69_005127 [Exophiala sideris]KAK5184643.1 hypothetical protein LTR44_003318 [Eurotiomycetes sp. CCFEE 6388]
MNRDNLETKLFINNEFVQGIQKKTFKIYNPLNEGEICEVHEALKDDVDLAVDAAASAFPHWSTTAAHERASYLFKFAQLVQRDVQELAELDSICMGK